jgi:hypothetical protein
MILNKLQYGYSISSFKWYFLSIWSKRILNCIAAPSIENDALRLSDIINKDAQLIWPDIRRIQKPKKGYPADYRRGRIPVPDIRPFFL